MVGMTVDLGFQRSENARSVKRRGAELNILQSLNHKLKMDYKQA